LQNDSRKIGEIVYHTAKDFQEKTDKVDLEILKILANNARISVVDIAGRLKTTPRIVQYRIKELEKKGIILAYKVHLNPKAMKRVFCKAIIYLTNVTKPRLKEFINYASSIEGAIWPQRVLGAWDFELDMELESYDKFQEIILDLKEKFSDIIQNHEFCIASKEFKLDLFPGAYGAER